MDSDTNSKILKDKYIPTTEFYSQVIDSLQDYSILTLDNNLLINSWSAGSALIFGYETDEVIGEHFDIIFTEEDKKAGIPKAEINTASIGGRAVDNRWHIRKDGSRFYAYGLVFPLTGMNGESLGYVKILRDLTERRKAEEAINKYISDLEELNNHKESILAILSHDLRSPLSSIIGLADYLRSDFEKIEKSEAKKLLELIYNSSIDELNMLDYLLEWARIKYASETYTPKETDLVKHVEKVFEKLNDLAAQASVRLNHNIAEKTIVFADEKMLLSILQNIVSNAIKHSYEGGEVIISSRREADRIIVQVRDNGTGISNEVQEKLFTPQIKSLSKTMKDGKGAGIGLLLVKGFLETHGGKIWVESVEGKGSSFYFTLPVDKPLENPPEKYND